MLEMYKLPKNITEHSHIRIITNTPTATTPIHMHEYFEIELVLSGKCKQMTNGSVYEVKRGSLYFLSPVDFHRLFDFEENIVAHNICFDSYFYDMEIVQSLMNRESNVYLQLSEEEMAEAESMIKLLKFSLTCEDRHTEKTIKNLLECFLIYIMRRCEDSNASTFSEKSSIQKAMKYLFSHYSEDPTASEMARICGYSTSHFCRQFKILTKKTYIEFLNDLKVNHAKILLLSTKTPIIEVADLCGFSSISNFNRVFREKTGISPSEFIKQNGGGSPKKD